MSRSPNGLPEHRPLMIAHRAGNSIASARAAAGLGADMIETDIWLENDSLEIRHWHRKGPFLWQRWSVGISFGPWLTLRDLLNGTPRDALLFLDLKGDEPELGPRILDEVRTSAPGRPIAVCGRNYAQLDPLIGQPEITLFYSVGEEQEWESAWPRLDAMAQPALSLHRRLATHQLLDRLKSRETTVVCWGVNTPAELEQLRAMGVDGFTTDSTDLIRQITAARTP